MFFKVKKHEAMHNTGNININDHVIDETEDYSVDQLEKMTDGVFLKLNDNFWLLYETKTYIINY